MNILEYAEINLSDRKLFDYWQWLEKVQPSPYQYERLQFLSRISAEKAKPLIWC